MTTLLSFDMKERSVLAADGLAPLAGALRAEIHPLIEGALPVPQQKARLTRLGGRCEFDGTLLNFDPWAPHEHSCPQCHRVFVDRAHDDWWAMGAQLWVAERAVQAAALQLVTNDTAAGKVAYRILGTLADRYLTWPNRDNVLGPTRPFFSTYLESIWLINLCHAIALLEQHAGADHSLLNDVREKLVTPSRELIASYHEGRSNRQVWNEVAVLSASRVLRDESAFHKRLSSKNGLFDLIANGLLSDGTWYEGENYHLFAHRGLWYGVQLLRAANNELPPTLEARYRAGFVTPFLGLLPDDTFPSRRDSQYRVSIRQWRVAEWCELGVAHAIAAGIAPDERLTGLLHRLYHPDHTESLKAQHRHQFSTADAERNEPPGLLSRADLSWRSLLMATPNINSAENWAPGSVCLPRQGLAIVRRDSGRTYVALEGGHTGGGHGHPDRLALTVQRGHQRWTEDPGTGSYVEQKLHWYRSTLAHAAPVIDGASQDAVQATLLAYEDRGGAGWMSKRVTGMKPGVNVQRTIVVCDGYLIDLLEWDATRDVQLDLPIVRNAELVDAGAWVPSNPRGAGGLEDGYDFLSDVMLECAQTSSPTHATRRAATFQVAGVSDAVLHYAASVPFSVWTAEAPGSPGRERAPMHWLRMSGQRGCTVGVWSWEPGVTRAVSVSGNGFESVSVTTGETESRHTRTELGWHIALKARHATSSIDLTYLPAPTEGDLGARTTESARSIDAASEVLRETAVHEIELAPAAGSFAPTRQFTLERAHYRQTEDTWAEAGKPSAEVHLCVRGDELEIEVLAATGEIVVVPKDAHNLMDNERPEVNADGVELFLGGKHALPWSASWISLPAVDSPSEADEHNARTVATTPGSPPLHAKWRHVALPDGREGFRMFFRIPLAAIPVQPDGTFIMELIVNERSPGRERRRGQLVLSGEGDFAYLRGDRADPATALTFRLPGRS